MTASGLAAEPLNTRKSTRSKMYMIRFLMKTSSIYEYAGTLNFGACEENTANAIVWTKILEVKCRELSDFKLKIERAEITRRT
jgi:spore coat protein U-like protein